MIRVNNDYIIEVETYNYVAKRDLHKTFIRADKITGEPKEDKVFNTVGYFSSIPGAIKGIIEDMNKRKLKDGAYDLREAVQIITESNRQFYDLLEKAMEI